MSGRLSVPRETTRPVNGTLAELRASASSCATERCGVETGSADTIAGALQSRITTTPMTAHRTHAPGRRSASRENRPANLLRNHAAGVRTSRDATRSRLRAGGRRFYRHLTARGNAPGREVALVALNRGRRSADRDAVTL